MEEYIGSLVSSGRLKAFVCSWNTHLRALEMRGCALDRIWENQCVVLPIAGPLLFSEDLNSSIRENSATGYTCGGFYPENWRGVIPSNGGEATVAVDYVV
jgi:hypothetical protein